MSKVLIYLGKAKAEKSGAAEAVYLYDFEWSCGWYWGGGYIGNKKFHTHFDSCFLKVPDYRGHPLGSFKPQDIYNGCALWEDLSTFLDNPSFTEDQWWRMKDLFKQFYAYKKAAECFHLGGNCTSKGRAEKEINLDMGKKINSHIELVIIPEIRKLCEEANKG